MSKKKSAGVIIAIATLLLICIVAAVWMVFKRNKQQTKASGMYQLESISSDFEKMISDSEELTLRTALSASELVHNRVSLQFFIQEQKKRVIEDDIGAFNVYIANPNWYIIPGFDPESGFIPTERLWYKGAIKNHGVPYVSYPYQDAVTGKICYSVAVMLGDNETVLGIDYNMDTIQSHIAQMNDDEMINAVIVTEDGVIAGCSDETIIGEDIAEALPEYTGVWSLSKNTNGVATARIKSDKLYENLFAAKASNGWYFIVGESDWGLYKSSYIQLAVTAALLLILFTIISILYVLASKSRRETEEALYAKEEFLKGVSSRLMEPVSKILNSSNLENDKDIQTSMASIHESGEKLSEMIEQILSYSNIVRTEKNNDTIKPVKGSRRVNKHYRAVILAIMIFVMVISLYMNLRMSYNWGNASMKSKAESYGYKLSEWVDTQKGILDMFVSNISTNPGILEDYDRTVNYLNDITSQYPEISVTYMASPDLHPTVFMNNGWLPEDENWHVEDREWYKTSLASETGWSVSEPYYDEQTGGYCITISECVYDSKTGKFLGIFGIDFFMDKLVEILGDSYTNSGYAFLVDKEGDIINHPYGSYQMSEESMTKVSDLEYNKVELNGERSELIKDYDGSTKMLLAIENDISGFGVYVVSDIWSIYGQAIVYTIVCLVAFLTCIILIAKTLSELIAWQDATNARMREATEMAIAAGRAKGHFLAQMSHEIRTPINAVLGMNELILRETDDDNIREYSTNLEISGKTLLSLINDILDFSKIEDGKLEIIAVKYNVSAIVNDLVNSIIERAKAKNLELVVNIDDKIPSELFGDEIRIKQVIMNILTNAVKYTEKGSVTLSMSYDKAGEEGTDIILHVSIKDTGIGIKPEDMKKLFSEFERIEEDRNRNIEGTGLGMAITKSLLEMMGTSLKVESVYGEGSNFYFDLKQPVVNWEPVGDYKKMYQNIVKVRNEYKEQFTAPDAKVLVVDDNSMNIKVFTGLVKKTKIKVDSAESGDEGLALMKENKYDIIFLDHMMPNKDGIETLKELKEDEGNINMDTPVLCLTANAISGAREEYMAAGFTDYLTKPIKPKELEDTLMKYLPHDMIN